MSGPRLAAWSLALCGFLPSTAGADAGSPAPESAPTREARGDSNEPPSAEESPEDSPDESPDESAESEQEGPMEEAPTEEEAAPDVERARSAPDLMRRPLRADGTAREETPRPDLGDTTPGRRDFLRRLRTTAESIEQTRKSERTRAHTDGDLTVLSNVAASPTESAAALAEPAASVARAEERPPEESQEPAPLVETTSEVVLASTHRAVADETASSTGWRWLWVLGGVATVLLVPIALLLTRATRSQ